MKTFEEIDEPTGKKLTFEYNYSKREDFFQELAETFSKELLEYGCGWLNGGTLKTPRDTEYFIFEMKGDGMRETDVFFMVYELDTEIVVEWKYNPIQTGYLVELKTGNIDIIDQGDIEE